MKSPPSAAGALAIACLAAFTVWITWRAKVVERSLLHKAELAALNGKPAPDFSLPALDGRRVSLADYRGHKKLVVTFWASWCGPCRAEMPALASLYQRARGKGADVEILAISVDSDRAEAQQFADEMRMPFPVLLDPDLTAARAYDIETIPALYFIDSGGIVTRAHAGFDPEVVFLVGDQLGIPDVRMGQGGPDGGRRN